MVCLWYFCFLHQKNWSPWYNWNIVGSGIKHHNPPNPFYIPPPHPSLLLSLCFQLKHNFVGLIKSPWVLDIIPVLFKFHKKSLICLKKNVSFFKDLTIAYSNLIPKKLWSSNYCYIIVQVQSIYVYNIGLLFFCLKSYACF